VSYPSPGFRPVDQALIVAAALAITVLAGFGRASAQSWPTQPLSLFDGRVRVAADASLTYGSPDPGWFTYTDYDTDALRRARAGVTVEARVSRRIALLAEVRAESGVGIRPYSWYLRFTPIDSGAVSIQAGRIPPVFGAYARRSYPHDNPLIGDPLVYQYLTTMRADAVPATADELVRWRGRGWLVRYSIGDPAAYSGLPVIAASRWDSGIQLHLASQRFDASVAVTAGTLSHPLVRDDNGKPQIAGHVTWRPSAALALGASAASGAFLGRDVMAARPDVARAASRQQAVGVDVETSWGKWLVRGEAMANQWLIPAIDAPRITRPLRLLSGYVEARYRVLPRLYLAARADRIGFSSVASSTGPVTWDADVGRIEFGVGYTLRRGLLAKSSVLSHWRDGGKIRRATLVGVQLLVWM
jgi:hypothetical protein